uniref:N/A n=1 Tax=Ganoderma boninense TaxID=34458 RepID=A0A5K1K3J3_9APHY|nr:N/A [Ganoderma boninense]
MEATSRVFRWFFASHSPRGIPAFAFKIRSITLHLSPPSQDNVSPSHSNVVLMHWKWVSRDLHHLRELAFLGTKVQFTGVRDLLAVLPPTARLRRFICEDDRLLFGSLNSLLNHQETLEDFGGFFDTGIDKPPMTPAAFLDRFSNVHTLDVGMSFVTLQNHPGSVKSLCVRLDWTWMLSVVRSVWRIFGTTVRTLRLERNGVLDGRELHDGYPLIEGQESPLFLCTHLNMPALRYLEIRDTALAEAQREGTKPPCPDAESLGKPPPSDDYDGVCNLDCLAWRPWWAKQGGEYRNCADAFVRAAEESWLPVRKVLMSLDERTSGVWDMWTRPDEDFPFERKCTWGAIKDDSWKHME